MMKIGILGYRGFVGNAVYKKFKNDNSYITIGIDKNDSIKDNLDLLINCAGTSKKFVAENDPLCDIEINSKIINKIIHLNFCELIHISSIDAIYSNTIYGINKLWIENLLKHIFDNTSVIRLSGLVGNGIKKNVIYDIINNSKILVTGNSIYNFIDIEILPIIIDKYIKTRKTKQTFNFASSKNISVNDILKLFSTNISCGDKSEIYDDINIDYIKNLTNIQTSEYYIKKFISYDKL